MTQRLPRRSRLVSAIRASLRPATTATALTVSLTLAAAGPVQAAMENGSPGKVALRPENQAARDEILFIDAHVVSPEKLLVGTKQGVETIILEEGRDGLEQITEALEQRDPVAVHIVAHGESGKLQLGDTWLDAKQLNENAALIRRWFPDSSKADLLLYACKLAEGAEGVAFVEKLAEIAGADVAASDDLTGHTSLGGDWELEVVSGDIEADLAFSEITIDEYNNTLATFTVTKTADTDDGTCDADCSLREAIEDANDNANSPTVDVVEASGVSGTIELDCVEYGDIDVYEDVTIEGSGMTELTVDGEGPGGDCAIFNVYSAGDVTVSDMRLQLGVQEEGGCTRSRMSDLTLNEVYFYDCYTDDEGGAVKFSGSGHTLTIRDSIFEENYAEDYGGAVFFSDTESGGTLLVENSDFLNNYATYVGGAMVIFGDETEVTVRDSYFYSNDAGEGFEEYYIAGGAIAFLDEEGSQVLIESSTFVENAAEEESAAGGALAFYGDNSEITVRDSYFYANSAGAFGGVIFFSDDPTEGTDGSEVVVENCYFNYNWVYEGSGGVIAFLTHAEGDSSLTVNDSEFIEGFAVHHGGAIFAQGESGDVTINDSFFTENYAGYESEYSGNGGGASLNGLDTATIYASTFYDNLTDGSGGALALYGNESVDIVNSTFSYNYTFTHQSDIEESVGGAIFIDESTVSIRHTTIAFNDAEYRGGGIFNNESATVYLVNTIVSDNYAEDLGPDLYGDFDVFFSLVSDDEDANITNEGGNIFNRSADLGPLTFIEGVYTPVHIPDVFSPVVDGGNPGFTSPPDFDQRDEPRILGASTDMGSVEQERVVRIIPTLSRIGMMLMGLMLAGAGFLGFRRKDQST